MKRFKGRVKNHVVLLEKGMQLPDGTRVEIRLPTTRRKQGGAVRRQRLKQAIQRILDNPITRYVGMDEIIEEMKREREERWNDDGRSKT